MKRRTQPKTPSFALFIIKIRERLGFETPDAFADAMKIKPSKVAYWERGTRNPGPNDLQAVLDFLNIQEKKNFTLEDCMRLPDEGIDRYVMDVVAKTATQTAAQTAARIEELINKSPPRDGKTRRA